MTQLINTWQDFSQVLITTNELDPMYSVIAGLNKTKNKDWMGRFVLYYILFYDAGGAADAANCATDKSFWPYLYEAVRDGSTVKRGAARRHFRGQKAQTAVATLQSFGWTPAGIVENMYRGDYSRLHSHIRSFYAGCQMGGYFIWKIYDIQNVCLGRPISLIASEALKYLPDEPRKAAAHFWPDRSLEDTLNEITSFIALFKHPIRDGVCGLAEAETILCAMRGYFGTRKHEMGDDIAETYQSLKDYPELQLLLPNSINGEYKMGTLRV